jgi:hypothetical protein
MTDFDAFEHFSINLIEAISKALKSLGQTADAQVVMDKAQNIEPFVREYLTALAKQHDPVGYSSCVLNIEESLEQENPSEYAIPYTAKYVDRSVLALWHYCRDESILDTTGSKLFGILEYDPDYRELLISSLLPVMDKLYGKPHD